MKRISLFFLVLLAATVVAPLLSSVSAQAVPDVKFADAWFGDIANKVEVAPGDEGVQLVVQLVNTEQKPFRYAEGILHLPEGFRDAVTGDRDTRPSVVQQIPSGGYFYFKFLVDIDKSVEVGVHKAVLEVRYVEWGEDDVSQTFMNIEFRVPGKSAIDVEANPSELEPGKEQELTITLRNTGSADAASLEVQVEAGSPGLAILSGQGKHVIGNLKAGSSTNIPVKVLASRALADSTSAIKLVISYLNSYGIPVQEVQSISLRIKPLGGVGVVLDAYLENPVLEPAKTSTLKIVVTNRGSETAEDVNVAIGLAQLPNPPLTLLEGSTSVKLGDLAPGESKQLSLKVFVNRLASGRSYSIPVSLTYADEEGRHVSQTGLTFTVLEESRANKLRIYADEYVKGGMIAKVNVTIENIAGEPLKDITLTFSPAAGWVTLLGPTTWNIPELKPGERKILKLEMYVPSETATGSTIGEPFNLRVDASFREETGQIKNEVHVLGMYVKGVIEFTLQEISIERLGKDLLLVGRLLNEGTEKAAYTRVQLIGGDLQSSFVSYLGDVDPNAPILFNIPLEKVLAKSGEAEVELKITYQNSLRQKGEAVIKAKVKLPSLAEESEHQESGGISLPSFWIIVAAVVVLVLVVAAVYLARRSRRVETL